jgi:hypothetical protein
MPTFQCAACGVSRQTARQIAGRRIRCPACGLINSVPAADVVEELPPVAEEARPEVPEAHAAEAEAAAPPVSPPPKRRRTSGAESLHVLRLIVWGVLAVWAFFQRSSYTFGMAGEDSAIRAAARAGDFAAQVVFAYVIAQAADHFLAVILRKDYGRS